MAITSRALRAAALTAAAVLALSACGGDDDDPLGNGADNPARAGEAPVPPSAAEKRTDEGAEEFARYYLEGAVNHAYRSGKLQAMVDYSHPLCIVCRATIGDIASGWTRGNAEGGQFTVKSADATKASDSLTNVEVEYSTTRYAEKVEDKTVFSSSAKTDVKLTLQLQWNSDKKIWQIREIVTQALRGGGGSTPSPSPTSDE